MNDTTGSKTSARRWLWPLLKWLLFAIVLVFVVRHGYGLWNDAKAQQVGVPDVRIHLGWLLASVGLAIVGWGPSVWYWRRLMLSLGENVSWKHAARAYFCGHLGKYVPGKAAVIVIRAALLKPEGVRTATAAFTVTYETLAYMASGVMAIVVLLPWWADEHGLTAQLPTTFGGRVAVALPMLLVCFVGWGVFSQFFIRFIRRLAKVSNVDVNQSSEVPKNSEVSPVDAAPLPKLSLRVCLTGIGPLAAGWFIHGLSLGCSIQAVSADSVSLSDLPLWTSAIATANILGFAAVFAPGGVGVREGLLMKLLAPEIGPMAAVLVALMARAVSFVSEIVTSAALYYLVKPSANRAG